MLHAGKGFRQKLFQGFPQIRVCEPYDALVRVLGQECGGTCRDIVGLSLLVVCQTVSVRALQPVDAFEASGDIVLQ